MASAIPPDLADAIEKTVGAVIAGEKLRGGGGASRQGAEVTLRYADGREQHCYLAWDARAGDPSRLPYFERETGILAALSGPLANAGVKIAPLIASFPSHLALLSELVGGNDRFPQAEDKSALAREFMAQLAAIHRINASHPSLAALADGHSSPAARVAANIARWKEMNLAAGADPILQLALTWLGENVPADAGPSVVLHGDAGPGNFLFEADQVKALLDWELTHLGDPMEDLAQIAVRSLIQPFVPMREAFAAYEAASGTRVDVARVRYYRLYFQLSFSVPSAALANAQTANVGASGTALLFGTMHRRVMARSVAELAGLSLELPDLPECAPDWTDRFYATALDDLKNDIVPGAANQRASAKAKELARLVKFWRMRASHGAAFDAAELAEVGAALGESFNTLGAARNALGMAIAQGSIPFAQATQLCLNRVTRETAIMADAMGALATTWYEDLD